MEIYKRNHFFSIIDNIFSSFIKVIIPFTFLAIGKLGLKGEDFQNLLVSVAILALIFIAVVAYSLIKWYKNVYYIRDNFIVMREGVFVVKRREIPFNKIQTINISQNIKQRIFHVAVLKIDTGNSSYGNAEVSIVIGKVDAELLRQDILNSRQRGVGENAKEAALEHKDIEVSKQFTISNRELLGVGLTSNAVFAGLAFIGSIYTLLNDYLSSLLDDAIREFDIFADIFEFKAKSVSAIILTILVIIIVFIIFSFIASVIGTFVKYYGFNVRREGKSIVINYGLLEKKNYVLPIAKIRAVYIKQNLLRQVFGLSAINVESIGYGNEKGEEAILYPIAGTTKRMTVLRELLPEFLFEENLIRVPKSTLKRFVISSSLLPILVSIIITVIFRYGYLSLLVVPIFVLRGLLEYKNSAVAANDRLICISNKAFTKNIALVAVRDIQSSSESSNYFQRRKNLFNYEISIHSNTFGKTIKVKNLDGILKDKLLNIII